MGLCIKLVNSEGRKVFRGGDGGVERALALLNLRVQKNEQKETRYILLSVPPQV